MTSYLILITGCRKYSIFSPTITSIIVICCNKILDELNIRDVNTFFPSIARKDISLLISVLILIMDYYPSSICI